MALHYCICLVYGPSNVAFCKGTRICRMMLFALEPTDVMSQVDKQNEEQVII
jgi:hypothetical protein